MNSGKSRDKSSEPPGHGAAALFGPAPQGVPRADVQLELGRGGDDLEDVVPRPSGRGRAVQLGEVDFLRRLDVGREHFDDRVQNSWSHGSPRHTAALNSFVPEAVVVADACVTR